MGKGTKARVVAALREHRDPARAAVSRSFFKTGKGQYGEGDVFWGVIVPDQRRVARRFRDLSRAEIAKLLDDRVHECRLTALFILIGQFELGDATDRTEIVKIYLEKLQCINNWDLVDASASKILGRYLEGRDRKMLDELAASGDIWRQRIAMIATYHFIQQGQFRDTLRIARQLIGHDHDLIHKAVGWMLREVGKRDKRSLERFLKSHYRVMPRTALRYAIERFPESGRQAYLGGKV